MPQRSLCAFILSCSFARRLIVTSASIVAAADEFGTPYFCNLWTGETQWERPSLATRSTFDYRTPADLVDPRGAAELQVLLRPRLLLPRSV